jgi:pimeloyl-ACP methyl ester carboxylesterase
MSYADTRDSEQLRILQPAIASFIQRYTSRPIGPGRRTLFLLPGGMGSQLLRARKPYNDGGPAGQTFQYDKVWLTLETFLGDALTLAMHKDGQGVFRDLGNRIMVADGAVELLGLTPYSHFLAWCELNDLDWFVFGWDWRRRIEETTAFFLSLFLPAFRSAVMGACGADPLQDFVLVGHSQGGMVVNLIIRQYNLLLNNMTRAITVAAPFYGYNGQLHRWFEGEPYFNFLGKTAIIKTITSMPAGYTLPYLDAATYAANKAALQGDVPFSLTSYPSEDAANAAQDVDPFNPGPQRYPTTTGFDTLELQHGLLLLQQLAAPLVQYADRLFNIRGIHDPPHDTVGSITWSQLPNPANIATSPIVDGAAVPGDGTQPAWTARLVNLPVAQWRNVTGAIDHMFMMEDAATQQEIASVL